MLNKYSFIISSLDLFSKLSKAPALINAIIAVLPNLLSLDCPLYCSILVRKSCKEVYGLFSIIAFTKLFPTPAIAFIPKIICCSLTSGLKL